MKTIKLVITAALISISFSSYAQDAPALEKKAEKQANFLMNKFDKDADKALSKEEATPKFLSKWFKFIDTNKDNSLSLNEIKATQLKKLKKKAGKAGGKVAKSKSKKTTKKVIDFDYSKLSYKELFKKLDADKNKKLVKSEFAKSASLTADFAKIDKNSNSQVTKRELKKYLKGLKK